MSPLLTSEEIAGMRSEVLATQLDHVCTVQRRHTSTTNPDGAPEYVYMPLLEDVACHYWETAEQELAGGENATITKERIIMAPNLDVKTADRIVDVVGYDGHAITGPLDVIEVLDRVNDTLLVVRAIR